MWCGQIFNDGPPQENKNQILLDCSTERALKPIFVSTWPIIMILINCSLQSSSLEVVTDCLEWLPMRPLIVVEWII